MPCAGEGGAFVDPSYLYARSKGQACMPCAGEAEGDELRRNYDFGEVVRRGFFPAEETQQAFVDAQGISKVRVLLHL
jgi:hypothetical protein